VFPNVPLASSRVPDQATEIAKFIRLQGVSEALFRTRTGDPLLTMEDSNFGYTVQERRLLARFPCNTAASSAAVLPSRRALSLPARP